MSTFAKTTSSFSSLISSKTGAACRQGPHHAAVKFVTTSDGVAHIFS